MSHIPCHSSSPLLPQMLFPETYARTAAWLRQESAAGQETLERCQAAIQAAVLGQPRFHTLASGLQVQSDAHAVLMQ